MPASRLVPWLAALLLSVSLTGQAFASDLTRYNDLRNDYIKVTNIQERVRVEERYVETQGTVTLQKIPYKEVFVTAELRQKPPSSMETVFNSAAEPYFKICMERFDAAETKLDDECQALHFQRLVKGNVGTTSFRLPADVARYTFRVAQKQPNKGGSFKLWTPN